MLPSVLRNLRNTNLWSHYYGVALIGRLMLDIHRSRIKSIVANDGHASLKNQTLPAQNDTTCGNMNCAFRLAPNEERHHQLPATKGSVSAGPTPMLAGWRPGRMGGHLGKESARQ